MSFIFLFSLFCLWACVLKFFVSSSGQAPPESSELHSSMFFSILSTLLFPAWLSLVPLAKFTLLDPFGCSLYILVKSIEVNVDEVEWIGVVSETAG